MVKILRSALETNVSREGSPMTTKQPDLPGGKDSMAADNAAPARRIGDSNVRGSGAAFDVEHADLRNFSRTVAEIDWLLVILVLLYHFYKGMADDNLPAVFAGLVIFTILTIALHYLKLFPNPTRGLLAIESWIMIAFITWILYFTGRLESPLTNLYFLPVIVSALTLGQAATLLQMGLVAACYLFLGYSSDPSFFTLALIGNLAVDLAPMVLVAYITTMLSADILNALARVKLISETDELTGIYNVRAFNALAGQEFKLAARYRRALSLMMIDSDDLKGVNDTYGHEAGDKLIRAAVAGIRAAIKSSDIVARYGGDEFVCLLPGAEAMDAAGIGERIRSRIAAAPLLIDGKSVPMSVSIGVASYPANGDKLDIVARNADKALYLSKSQGRNRVTVYTAP